MILGDFRAILSSTENEKTLENKGFSRVLQIFTCIRRYMGRYLKPLIL
jgi:hypothetical protein